MSPLLPSNWTGNGYDLAIINRLAHLIARQDNMITDLVGTDCQHRLCGSVRISSTPIHLQSDMSHCDNITHWKLEIYSGLSKLWLMSGAQWDKLQKEIIKYLIWFHIYLIGLSAAESVLILLIFVHSSTMSTRNKSQTEVLQRTIWKWAKLLNKLSKKSNKTAFQSGWKCTGGIRCDMYWSVDVFVIHCARDYIKLSN